MSSILIDQHEQTKDSESRHVGGVIGSEWLKLRSVRSTTWTLLTTAVLTIGIGALGCWAEKSRWSRISALQRLHFDPTSRSLSGVFLGQLTIGVLGVLVISSEYASGMIRSTLAAITSRSLVIATKALVFVFVAFVVSEAIAFASFFIGQSVLTGGPPHATLGEPSVLRAVFGSGLYLALLGLLALGLASIIRHTAGAITVFVGVVLILPLLTSALPTSMANDVSPYLPLTIGSAIKSVSPQSHAFSPWTGLLLLAGYAILALVVGAWLMTRRDA